VAESSLVLVKLGGSLITDKTRPMTARPEVIGRCAEEIAKAWRAGTRLVVGHGSGSFGHSVAKRYGTRQGVHSESDWYGFAQVAQVAREMDRLVLRALLDAGVPAVALPPSASARARAGELERLDTNTAAALLAARAVPVVFGDVALDEEWGGTIVSTEQVLGSMAVSLKPDRLVLAGEVEGVFDGDPHAQEGVQLIPAITRANYSEVLGCLGQARGADVTGGMADKVRRMYALTQQLPTLRVQLINGLHPDLIYEAIVGQAAGAGTTIGD
jgi:isopentenyl phosphate kinase